MKTVDLKDKRKLVATVLLVVAVMSALLIVVKVTGFFVNSAQAENAVQKGRRRPEREEPICPAATQGESHQGGDGHIRRRGLYQRAVV